MKHLPLLRLGVASSSLLFVVSTSMDTCARAGGEPDSVHARRLGDFEDHAACNGGMDLVSYGNFDL